MRRPNGKPLALGIVLLALASCDDRLAGPEAPGAADESAALAATWRAEAARDAAAGPPLPGFSPGMQTAMTRTVVAALEAVELRSDLAVRLLQEFLDDAEARRQHRIDDRDER